MQFSVELTFNKLIKPSLTVHVCEYSIANCYLGLSDLRFQKSLCGHTHPSHFRSITITAYICVRSYLVTQRYSIYMRQKSTKLLRVNKTKSVLREHGKKFFLGIIIFESGYSCHKSKANHVFKNSIPTTFFSPFYHLVKVR